MLDQLIEEVLRQMEESTGYSRNKVIGILAYGASQNFCEYGYDPDLAEHEIIEELSVLIDRNWSKRNWSV